MSSWRFQAKAARDVASMLSVARRAQLVMACGTGKTRVGLRVIEKLGARKVLVLVPSLALIEQICSEYRRESKERFSALAVCSDPTLNSEHLQVARGEDEIEKFLRKRGVRVLFCTYHSAEYLEGCCFDLGVFDEAHRTAGNVDKLFAYALYDENIKIRKRLFMTATPRRSPAGSELAGMDSEGLYGEVAYNLPFREAVSRGVIADYKIVVPVIKPGSVGVEPGQRAAAISLEKTLKKTGAKKCFSYHPSIRSAQRFSRELNESASVPSFHVNGRMTTTERVREMGRFSKSKRGVLTNARCLIEGVDLPSVDVVAFTHRKKSVVDIVQAVGRAMRKSPGKRVGYIFVPLYLNPKESVEGALVRSRYDSLYDVILAMREQDSLFAEALSTYESGDAGALERFVEFTGPEATARVLRKRIAVRVLTPDFSDVAQDRKRELVELASKGGRRPNWHNNPPLAYALRRFTSRHRDGYYDQELHNQLKKAVPEWFGSSGARRRAELLERARAGKPKPSWKTERKLADMLRRYVKPGEKVYNKEFADELFRIRPDWHWTIYNGAVSNKDSLLYMAITGEPKPTKGTDAKMANALRRYTTKGDSYDRAFHKKIVKAAAGRWRLPPCNKRKVKSA